MRHFRAKSQHLDTLVSSQRRHLRERGLRGLKQSLLLIIGAAGANKQDGPETAQLNKCCCRLDLRCMLDDLSD